MKTKNGLKLFVMAVVLAVLGFALMAAPTPALADGPVAVDDVSMNATVDALIWRSYVDPADNVKKFVLVQSLGGATCAWPVAYNISITGAVQGYSPICGDLRFLGTGTVTMTIWPDPLGLNGYRDVLNTFPNSPSLALWVVGENVSMNVTRGVSTTVDNTDFRIGNHGVNIPIAGGPVKLVFTLSNGLIIVPIGPTTQNVLTPEQDWILPAFR